VRFALLLSFYLSADTLTPPPLLLGRALLLSITDVKVVSALALRYCSVFTSRRYFRTPPPPLFARALLLSITDVKVPSALCVIAQFLLEAYT